MERSTSSVAEEVLELFGDPIEVHAMLEIHVRLGQIARHEEYLDAAQAASLSLPGPTAP